MENINNVFSDLGGKMPFGSDFFQRNVAIGSAYINTLFLCLIALVVVVIAVVVIAVCLAKVAKTKKAAKAQKAAQEGQDAPAAQADEQTATASEQPTEATDNTDAPSAEESVIIAQTAADDAAQHATDTNVNPSDDTPQTIEETPQMKKEVKAEPAATAKPKKEVRVYGTFEVSLCLDGYRFYLYASNKQLMYESVGFTSEEGAMKGIETFRKTLQDYPYIITKDKYDHYRYVFNKRYQGENYTSKQLAQSAAESVKRWAANAKVIVRPPKPEELQAYKDALAALRTKDDVDWDAVEQAEANVRKMGKFTVEEEGNQDEIIGYRFYLIANNAQILYTSAIYTTAAGALKGIDAFKKAVYIGNFYVDEDKFGRFRYILRSLPATTYVGESYETRARAESSIESVKKFVQCATIVPYKKTTDAE